MPLIRILHVLDNLGRGGLQNGLVNLIDRLDPRRFEHIVCSTRYLASEQSHQFPADRARVVCVSGKDKASRFQAPELARIIRESQPDIVHSRNWGGVEAILAGRWTGSAALVHSEHGLDPDTVDSEPWRRIAVRRLAYSIADRVFCVSDQLRQLYAGRTGFPSTRISVIHNGVDTTKFIPDAAARERLRREFGLRPEDFCIGCVGRFSPIKDYPTVLRAVGELDKTVQNWRLLIVGDGPERPRMEELLAQHPAWGGKVTFLGLSKRVAELLNAMDVYVLSSITEGISNSLLEAMAAGLPVLATATGGNPEVVADGQSGMLFPVGDAPALARHLLTLHARPERRAALASGALNRIRESFSLEAMVRNYESLYLGLVPQSKMSPEVICT